MCVWLGCSAQRSPTFPIQAEIELICKLYEVVKFGLRAFIPERDVKRNGKLRFARVRRFSWFGFYSAQKKTKQNTKPTTRFLPHRAVMSAPLLLCIRCLCCAGALLDSVKSCWQPFVVGVGDCVSHADRQVSKIKPASSDFGQLRAWILKFDTG